jgi:uncharacterized damage-inducible protein DinB
MRFFHRVIPVAFLISIGTTPVSAQNLPDFRAEILGQFEASARRVVALAEAMPADTYDWEPMEGVASVGTVFMHIARYNLMYPEENLGVPGPFPASEYGDWENSVTEKAETVRLLSESMDWVRKVIGDMSDADLESSTVLYGRDVAKASVLLQLVTHMKEHLGQSIAYARMNGVVPPWSM